MIPEKMRQKYLYRALREDEILAGFVLIPKTSEVFQADPAFGVDDSFPLEYGSQTNAVRQHQWEQKGLPTRGVSTTPHLKRAQWYGEKTRVVVKIDVSKLADFQIQMFDVNQTLKDEPSKIAVPEDEEIILVWNQVGNLPVEIIAEVIYL